MKRSFVSFLRSFSAASSRRFPREADRFLAAFRDSAALNEEAYRNLFLYFLEGFEAYRHPDGAAADYPGLRSNHGVDIDAMEGFTRMLPLVGAWISSDRPTTPQLAGGKTVDLLEWVRRGVLAGTDSTRSSYWGDIQDFDQRICEAADIALGLWLTRGQVWAHLTPAEKGQVTRWLSGAIDKRVVDNNWHLFITSIGVVLTDLGASVERSVLQSHYDRMKSFYRGHGWFSDGPGKKFDYYNAWGVHYLLFWIEQIDPDWDAQFIRAARREFVTTYKYLIARDGLPIMGRSICYRMAAPAPLIFAHSGDPDCVSAAEARRGLDLVWRYFIRHGAAIDGAVTQGYCAADPRVLDNYSGPASCLWALRSLVVAFHLRSESQFWITLPGQLPIDQEDYEIEIDPPGWRVRGNHETGSVEIINSDSLPPEATRLADYSLLRRLKTFLRSVPHRPDNETAKYKRRVYSSAEPFCGCRLRRVRRDAPATARDR